MPTHCTVTLVGHIAEPKFATAGESLTARFGLATSRKRKDSEVTTWWNVTCWRKDAEFVQKYIKKGALLLIEGEAYEEEYEGKKYLKVEARKVVSLGQKPAGDAVESPVPVVAAKPVPSKAQDLFTDEPPF